MKTNAKALVKKSVAFFGKPYKYIVSFPLIQNRWPLELGILNLEVVIAVLIA